MYQIIVRLLVVTALLDLGMSITREDLNSKKGLERIRKAAVQVAKISWKPISIFPLERKKFQ